MTVRRLGSRAVFRRLRRARPLAAAVGALALIAMTRKTASRPELPTAAVEARPLPVSGPRRLRPAPRPRALRGAAATWRAEELGRSHVVPLGPR